MFLDPNLNDTPIVCLGTYHPYRIYGERNPHFDSYSGRILDVKESKDFAITQFFNRIHAQVDKDICVCYVPSSTAYKDDTGVRRIAIKVAEHGRHDTTGCLVRHTTIEKLATGGDRSIEVHLNSIEVQNSALIKGKRILIIDDVTTSNNSLLACKQLLLEAGAAEVYCLALGQTV